MEQPNSHISKAHDHFFRMMMSDKRVAREFFLAHLPKEVLSVIDLNQLEMQPGSYIDDMRQESIADILFKTTIKGREAYIYLLVDHQSRPDELMPWRVLKYLCNVIDQYLKDTEAKRIPLILPMVVYHGKDAWNYSTNINDLVDAPRNLVDAYFLKPFNLIDLSQIEDKVLKQNIWSGVMELTLKHIFARDMLPYLKEIVELLKYLENAGAENFVEIVLIYILDRGELSNKDSFLNLIKTELAPELGDKFMTLREQWEAEGIQKGIQQGMQQGFVKGQFEEKLKMAKRLLAEKAALSFIAKVTGLSLQQIEELI